MVANAEKNTLPVKLVESSESGMPDSSVSQSTYSMNAFPNQHKIAAGSHSRIRMKQVGEAPGSDTPSHTLIIT